MATDKFFSRTVGWLAISSGIVGILAVVFLALFFGIGEPFGTLNDIFSGLLAISIGILAWGLERTQPPSPSLKGRGARPRGGPDTSSRGGRREGVFALIVALAGAVIAVIGSVL